MAPALAHAGVGHAAPANIHNSSISSSGESSRRWPYKKDPSLQNETRDVNNKYPFALSTNDSQPLDSRFLVSLRTQNDFNDVDKLNPRNTIEAIQERARLANPYTTNRTSRRTTKGTFNDEEDVQRVREQTDGFMQQTLR